MDKDKNSSIEKAKKLVSSNFSTSGSFVVKTNCPYIYETGAPKDLEDSICELEGKYVGRNKEDNTLILDIDGKDVILMPVKDTLYSDTIKDSVVPKGDKWYVIAIKVEDQSVYIPVIILRDKEKDNFSMIKSLYGRAHAIAAYYKLENGQKNEIERRVNTTHYNRFEMNRERNFFSRRSQMLLYALTKETYPLDAQRIIELMFSDNLGEKHKVSQRLPYILGITPTYRGRIAPDRDSFEKILEERFYKMDRPKRLLKDVFMAIERMEKKGCNLLFVGSPGVGKTSLMMAIADIMNIPFGCIALNGLTCGFEIDGLDPGYDAADAGTIVKTFFTYGTSQMIVCLDEFDKMNRDSKEGDPMHLFLRLFTGDHFDKFLQCTVKTDNTIFIATANSIDNIPEAILNRFNAVIYFDEYTCEDKMVIARKHLIPDVLDNCHIEHENVVFEDDALKTIITRYCEDGGARDLKHNIEKIVNRIISENKADTKTVVSSDYVEEILYELVEETPAICFNRNREYYSKPVADEIIKCIEASKNAASHDPDKFLTEKRRRKLEYLLALKTEQKTYMDAFNPKQFSKKLHEDVFGMDKVIEKATNFYYTAYLQGSNLNSNLALCGGFGIGKTTIVKSIAKAMDYNYVKISLNGISRQEQLRGFSSTYTGSEPGYIIKGYKEAGSLRTVVQLDEIDKLNPEMATILLDILDRDFTDSFLSVPVDLTQSIFIATANEWGKVPAVLRDRFIVVDVDGYTRNEKHKIIDNYIIPRLEKGYAAKGVSISIDDDARKYLLETYANSFGVRDAEKAMQEICTAKLVDQADDENAMLIHIERDDVKKYLGDEPIVEGNFPDNSNMPGIAKALAVGNDNSNIGKSFAIETVLIDGNESLEMTGLPKDSAKDSVKIAVTCINKMYPELLKGKHIHVHFGEGSVQKDGPSAGVALFMSILSAAINKVIMDKHPYDIAYTGELSLTGGVFAIGGTYEKLQAACDSGCSKVFIPMQNYERLDKDKLKEFTCEIIPVTHISQVVSNVFPELAVS